MVSKMVSGSKLGSCISLLSLLANLVSSASNMPTECYVIDGEANSNAGFRCNNATSGHSSCCQIGAVCYSNGVCQQSNGGVQDYLRVGCTDPTWQDAACLDQCTTYATDSTAGIRFCGGSITQTTSYCCDNGTFGIGSFACCDTPSDIFAIKPAATVVAQIPLTYSSTSTSQSSSSTSTSSSSTSSIPAATTTAPATSTPSSSSGSSSHTTAIAVGVAVPVGIIALAALGLLFWRRRKNQKNAALLAPGQQDTSYAGGYSDAQEAPGSVSMAAASPDPKKGYWGGRQYEPAPTEMDSPNVVHEMPAGR